MLVSANTELLVLIRVNQTCAESLEQIPWLLWLCAEVEGLSIVASCFGCLYWSNKRNCNAPTIDLYHTAYLKVVVWHKKRFYFIRVSQLKTDSSVCLQSQCILDHGFYCTYSMAVAWYIEITVRNWKFSNAYKSFVTAHYFDVASINTE